jgi:hypothetical protein
MARARFLLLLLPFIAYLYPAWYDRVDPRLFGFPFFYWYQLLWIALTSLLIALALALRRQRR